MRAILPIMLVAVAVACQSLTTEPSIRAARPELSSAPIVAAVSGQNVSIEPYLWRDFMPSSPPDGKPLIVVVRVRAVGAVLAASTTADSIWVISEGQAWASRASQERPRSETGNLLEVVARDGPKWGPAIRVDVVVRLRDAEGRVSYVRAVDQLINRTD